MANEPRTHISSYLDWSDKGKAGLWRYVIGFVLTIVVFFLLSGIGLIPLVVLFPDYQSSRLLSVVALLLSFVIAFLAIPAIVQLLHRRPFWSVAMPRLAFEQWNFWSGFGIGIAVALVFAVPASVIGLIPIAANPDFSWGFWLPLVLIGFVGIFIQAGSEELLFRGYFTQFARRFTANPYIFIGIPALLFALPHIANVAALGGTLFVMIPYFISGLLYAWAAYQTGSLWMGLGLHLANNYSGLVLIGTQGDVLPSAAPFQIEAPGLVVGTLFIAAQTVVTILVLNYLIARRRGAVVPAGQYSG